MKKNILVTGSHRSGSTWVGRVIARSKKVRYIQEPFNIENSNFDGPFSNQFESLYHKSPEHQKKARLYIESFYSIFHIGNINKIFKIRSRKDIRRFFADIKSRLTRRSLIKDPLAVMSAEWIYSHYGWDVVLLIRHPAAFVASLKVKDWQFYFYHFSMQKELMSKDLSDYLEQVKEYSNNEKDIINQGILLWNIIYSTVIKYQKKYKNDWYFVRHEDISNNPLAEFEKIFKFLSLDFEDQIKNYIIESTTSNEQGLLRRDSKKNIKTWKERLSDKEISHIKEMTYDVWTNFYSEDDW